MNSRRTISHPRNASGLTRLILGAAAAGWAFLASAEPDARGKQLFNNCVACHGQEAHGNKLLNAPALAGLSEKYLVAQLQKFKTGLRGGDVRDVTGLQMRPMAQILTSEEDMQQVSAYIAALPRAKQEPTLKGDPARGKAFYATCQACHNADGSGNDLLNSPGLIGQHDWYLASQLHKFKDGVRGGNPQDITGSQMRPMAMMLTDEQAIADVVAYIGTLAK